MEVKRWVGEWRGGIGESDCTSKHMHSAYLVLHKQGCQLTGFQSELIQLVLFKVSKKVGTDSEYQDWEFGSAYNTIFPAAKISVSIDRLNL